MTQIIHKEESFQLMGILFEIHKNLGGGFSEIVYKDALEYELKKNKYSFRKRKRIYCSIQRHYLKS